MAGDAHLRRGQQRSQHCPLGEWTSRFTFFWLDECALSYVSPAYITGSGLVMAIINEEDDHSSRCLPRIIDQETKRRANAIGWDLSPAFQKMIS